MKKNKKYIIPIIISCLLLFSCYWVKNIPLPFNSSEGALLKYCETFKSLICHNKKNVQQDTFLLINTCYDLELIPYYEEDTLFSQGVIAITNRKVLYDFLKEAKKYKYRYLILDIDFDDIDTEYNDSIVNILADMNNVCVARSKDYASYNSKLDSKAGWVDYFTTPSEQGFVKYNLMSGENYSMPLKVYQELYGKKIKRCLGGLFYLDNHSLCQKTVYTRYKILQPTTEYQLDNENRKDYSCLNLGSDVVATNNINIIEGKTVMVGDFFSSNDIHDTYVGKMSGALVNLNTIVSVKEGKHKVHWYIALLLFALYYFLSRIILFPKAKKNKKRNKWIKNISTYPITRFIISFVGYGGLFTIVSLSLYVICGYYYSIWLPIATFTILSHIMFLKKHEYELQEA